MRMRMRMAYVWLLLDSARAKRNQEQCRHSACDSLVCDMGPSGCFTKGGMVGVGPMHSIDDDDDDGGGGGEEEE